VIGYCLDYEGDDSDIQTLIQEGTPLQAIATCFHTGSLPDAKRRPEKTGRRHAARLVVALYNAGVLQIKCNFYDSVALGPKKNRLYTQEASSTLASD
jgi:hypothetical protein